MLLHGRRTAARQPATPRHSATPPAAAGQPAARSAALRRSATLRLVCAIAAAAVLPVLAGCEAGTDAPVLHWHPPTAGASTSIVTPGGHGYLAIRNVFVLGAPLNAALPAGSSAGLFMAMVNTGPGDRLLGVTAPGTATRVTVAGGSVSIPTDQSALLTGPAPEIVLRGLLHTLPSGGDIKIVLRFQRAGLVTMVVPVMAKVSYYATYSPAPAPSPTATRHRLRPHPVPTASPGGTPAASATGTG